MISFLFWNVGSESRALQIAQLAKTHDVDVILLAEVVDQPTALLRVSE